MYRDISSTMKKSPVKKFVEIASAALSPVLSPHKTQSNSNKRKEDAIKTTDNTPEPKQENKKRAAPSKNCCLTASVPMNSGDVVSVHPSIVYALLCMS